MLKTATFSMLKIWTFDSVGIFLTSKFNLGKLKMNKDKSQSVDKSIGKVARHSEGFKEFWIGEMFEVMMPIKKAEQEPKVRYLIWSSPVPKFLYASGDTMQDAITDFIAQSRETNTVPFIAPEIFEAIVANPRRTQEKTA